MDNVTSALVALGSNLPFDDQPPERIVAAAMADLARLGRVAARSRLWRSPAWPSGPPYVNAAARVETALAPAAALAALHAIEAERGRARAHRWAPRSLDLDLLAWGDLVCPDAATQATWRALDPAAQAREAPAALVLPHPRMQDRGFVLLPLAEVAPAWRHPLLGLDVAEMLARLPPEALEDIDPLLA